MYQGAIGRMEFATSFYALNTGVFTDELNASTFVNRIDGRVGVDTSEMANDFQRLSAVRSQAQQAIGALSLYPEALPENIGELYALQGMVEVMMAESFCSGIPLATTPFGKDFTYSGAISTHDVLTLAVAHFDTALTYAGDSASVVTLARVGKGRALLDLNDAAAAATAVAAVPTSGQYLLQYSNGGNTNLNTIGFQSNVAEMLKVRSGEGQNGIQWVTSPADPRVPLDQQLPVAAQAKYTNTTPIVLSDGVEARLIEAEAKLRAHDYAGWIGTLQALAAAPGTPGSAGIAGVTAPTDPGAVNGSDSARVTRHFEERARWLFLTGHREGDLRRLVRQYGRAPTQVYPSGAYLPLITGIGFLVVYGNDVTVSPPASERANNPLYKGCIDRHA